MPTTKTKPTQIHDAEPKPEQAPAPYSDVISTTIFSVLDDLALDEDDIGRVVRKMKRMNRDHAPESEQKALFEPMAKAIIKSVLAEPIGKDAASGMLLLPPLKLPRSFLANALKNRPKPSNQA